MKKLIFWIKFDRFRSLIGLFIGIMLYIFLLKYTNNMWTSLIYSLIIALITIIFIQMRSIDKYANNYAKIHDKDRYIDSKELRGYSENFDKLLDLDEEVSDFFNKHSSYDYFEKELNKQWAIHGDDFVKRADELLSTMTNEELLFALLGTNMIKDIVDVFKYFRPYKINVKYLKEHPEKAKEYYLDNLMQQNMIRTHAINEYYYKAIMDLNYFDEIEKIILSYMSNEEIMELANSSSIWRDKLYFYGFLKEESK